MQLRCTRIALPVIYYWHLNVEGAKACLLGLLESRLPGVFAAGEVRSGNVKRVASAVGEGAISVHLVHRTLAEL